MSRKMMWEGHVTRMREKRNVCRSLVGKSEVKRSLRRPRRSRVDNIKTVLVEIGLGGVDWMCKAQDKDKWRPLVNAVINLQVL
jgi:hypothetical protein